MNTARKLRGGYTYADYLRWEDDQRYELVDGSVYGMTPAPSRKHQEISMRLSFIIAGHLKGRRCKIFAAPFDVRLPEAGARDEEIYTVVQPDIVVVCDPKKLDERGCLGSPDLVMEIASPSTAERDMKEKLSLYERHGVKEYWIVFPGEGDSMRLVLVFNAVKSGGYGKPAVYGPGDTIKSKTLRGLSVSASELFGL
ncbi:MAG TPA: Uma2 family endonuclease [Spirochaetota bacterium]|nr:Uma2 family endonuclease [Spirochaetota bacterium]